MRGITKGGIDFMSLEKILLFSALLQCDAWTLYTNIAFEANRTVFPKKKSCTQAVSSQFVCRMYFQLVLSLWEMKIGSSSAGENIYYNWGR